MLYQPVKIDHTTTSEASSLLAGCGLYRVMRLARELDATEQSWVQQGRAFFHVSGAGHEATAALARHLTTNDWIHAHYRDKALLLARGISVREYLASLICRATTHSAGRQMSAHLSAPQLNVLSIVGPVGNNALQACGIAAALKDQGDPGIVVCSVGDGTTQQGEFLEAVSEAVRWQLPVLFLIQDNHYSISTPTRGKTFFDLPSGPAAELFGIPIRRANGSQPIDADQAFASAIKRLRTPQPTTNHKSWSSMLNGSITTRTPTTSACTVIAAKSKLPGPLPIRC